MPSPPWRIEQSRRVERVLKRLPRPLLRRIDRAIEALAQDPRPIAAVKLAGFENFYRIRVGDWRITYSIEDDVLLIVIVEVRPRGDAYRNL